MKDAIGATWLMGIVLVFVVLFSGFLAFAVNYSKAFKVKNEIINILEKNMNYDQQTQEQIEKYLIDIGYDYSGDKVTCPKDIYGSEITTNSNKITDGIKKNNYCIKASDTVEVNEKTAATTYKVTTFVMVDMPLIWQSFYIPVSGETKRVYTDRN